MLKKGNEGSLKTGVKKNHYDFILCTAIILHPLT